MRRDELGSGVAESSLPKELEVLWTYQAGLEGNVDLFRGEVKGREIFASIVRIAEVEEVANLVVMLASPMMEMVNGTMIEIDGGQDKPLMDRFRDR